MILTYSLTPSHSPNLEMLSHLKRGGDGGGSIESQQKSDFFVLNPCLREGLKKAILKKCLMLGM